ncbi:MAG: cytochrome C [Acidobacteria bacterium]|nr:cytochrome C [Acidobacteriota bacterium]
MFRKPHIAPLAAPALQSPSTPNRATLTLATIALAAAAILWQPSPVAASTAPSQDPAPNTLDFYNHHVLPILQTNCYRCHGGFNHRGGLNIVTRAGLLKGGHDGTVIIPGDASKSLLVKLIRHEGPANDPMPMPPKSKISDADIATITQWINAGAIMPDTPPQ